MGDSTISTHGFPLWAHVAALAPAITAASQFSGRKNRAKMLIVLNTIVPKWYTSLLQTYSHGLP